MTANYVATNTAQLSADITALNAVAGGGSIVVASNTAAIITGQLQIQKPMTITCMANSSISEGSTGTLFVVSASNFVLQNCNVTDTNSGSSAITYNSASNFQLLNNTISGTVHMQGATQGLIQGNTVTGIVFGEMNTSYIRAIGNYITVPTAGGSGLQFHGTTSGETVSHLILTGNHIVSSGTYCVEVGAFGSGTVPPADVVVSNNTCDLAANSDGGYSMDTVIAPVVSGNTFDANGFTASNGVEIVNSYYTGGSGIPTGPGTGAIVKGNMINGAKIDLNKQSNNLVEGNYINMGPITSGIYIGGGVWSTNYNQVRNNTIVCGSCTSASRIIFIQSDNGTTPALGNQIIGNNLIGMSNGEYGVFLSAGGPYTTPVFGQTLISGNVFQAISNDIHPQANTFNTYLFMNSCSVSSTWIPTSLPSNVTIIGEGGTSGTTCTISQ